jgi:hypothetical protein
VTLKRLGYSAVERARLAADRLLDGGDSLLNELAHSIVAKDVRVDKALAADLGAGDLAAAASGQALPSATAIPKPSPALFPKRPAK